MGSDNCPRMPITTLAAAASAREGRRLAGAAAGTSVRTTEDALRRRDCVMNVLGPAEAGGSGSAAGAAASGAGPGASSAPSQSAESPGPSSPLTDDSIAHKLARCSVALCAATHHSCTDTACLLGGGSSAALPAAALATRGRLLGRRVLPPPGGELLAGPALCEVSCGSSGRGTARSSKLRSGSGDTSGALPCRNTGKAKFGHAPRLPCSSVRPLPGRVGDRLHLPRAAECLLQCLHRLGGLCLVVRHPAHRNTCDCGHASQLQGCRLVEQIPDDSRRAPDAQERRRPEHPWQRRRHSSHFCNGAGH
jgi:hypothetical protein